MSGRCEDTISRREAIDAKQEFRNPNVVRSTEARTAYDRTYANGWNDCNSAWIDAINALPSAQPTLYGYNIEHLELIARVLQKENLPPERIVEVLTDIGRIVAIVKDEFEEALRKAVEQCTI